MRVLRIYMQHSTNTGLRASIISRLDLDSPIRDKVYSVEFVEASTFDVELIVDTTQGESMTRTWKGVGPAKLARIKKIAACGWRIAAYEQGLH